MTSEKKSDGYYKITYREALDGKVLTLKARTIQDSKLGMTFIAASDFVFETKSSVFVNPIEESKAQDFRNVKTLHLAIYSILSIEEIGQENPGLRFEQDKSKLVVLPISEPRAPK